jgi:hypothetical protein
MNADRTQGPTGASELASPAETSGLLPPPPPISSERLAYTVPPMPRGMQFGVTSLAALALGVVLLFAPQPWPNVFFISWIAAVPLGGIGIACAKRDPQRRGLILSTVCVTIPMTLLGLLVLVTILIERNGGWAS